MTSNQHETPISADRRVIDAIMYTADSAHGWRIGMGGVTRIEAYNEVLRNDEKGHPIMMAAYFAVYQADHLLTRIPAHIVTPFYARPAPAEGAPV